MANTPLISCVVIGRNCEKFLSGCFNSLQKISYDHPIEIIYIDGASDDNSVAIAQGFSAVTVIESGSGQNTPGKSRNQGWKLTKGEWVQFFDGDCVAASNWLKDAVNDIDDKTAAIFGWIKEVYPHKNWFHFTADLEWLNPVLEKIFFGGNVLIRRSVLEETGGYDESLIAGEDPELAVRIRNKGWNIKGLNTLMCHHDIRLDTFSQYLRRSFRTGIGYAQAGLKMLKYGKRDWFIKTMKILTKGILFFLLLFTGIFLRPHFLALLAILILFFPFSKMLFFQKKFNLSLPQAFLYSFHCCLVFFPHLFGIIWYFTKFNK